MALIKCPECGCDVSDKAGVCIHCGCPLITMPNVVTVKFPDDKDIAIRLKYAVTDLNGNVLACGKSGDVASFEANEPTELKCSIQGRMYSDYEVHPIAYVPHGNVQYSVIRVRRVFKAWVEMQEGCVVVQPSAPNQQEEPKRGGTSAFGVFVAIVLAGLVLWYMVAPYSTPTWMQHIGGTIKAVLSGEDSYKIIDWDKYGK